MKFGPKAAGAAIFLSAALALTGCGGGGSATGSGNGGAATTSLTIAELGDLPSFDPVDAHIGHTMPYYQAVYDTLLIRDADGTISPMLAAEKSWNADNTVLTLKLRTDAKFTDGTPVDAAAVKANLDHFQQAKGRDVYQVASMASVAVVDPSTVAITLSTPDPAFEYYLTQAAGFVASPKAIGTPGIKTDPVGSGPYKLDTASSVKGSQYVYTKNPDYWNKDLQKFEKVTIKSLPDITARTNALVSGQIDGALLDPKTGKQAEGAGLVLTKSEVDWHGILLYDRDGKINPEMANVKVRQAINYAFDRKTILDQQFLGQGTPTSQVFGPDSGAFVADLDNRYSYDPAKAKQLLAEAGYPEGFTLKIPTMAGFEALNAVYSQQLSDIGIKVQLESVPQANYVGDMAAGKFAAATFQLYQGEPWVAINQMISTSALYNPFKSTNPEIAALVEEVHVGGENSSELAKKVNTYVTENAWFAPLFRLNQMYYTSKKITVEPQLQQAVPSIYNYAPAK
ncbi:ABC transporter substrate-binding protein [Arthrobacter sp. Leaf137]|uniref:ABC transporter substrate-binding protein n=1 Tax=Arthrobacter sp. Leaf137 TaxID=1736271 RepID=UPI0006FC4A3D|nr:ABC transporter substrate-binding protein [Arthrobacter sp. Leaf137]KQQ90010.1 ABC transporter substrate-binding protein [Arthrobacter sp. Leaf137]